MLRSMLAAVSGLRAHQTMMDVVGNNISNVNTPGFKSSRVTFEEALTDVIGGATQSGDARGGTNPQQLGLGTKVSAIDTVFAQGASLTTGRSTDLAIQGDGFFMLDIDGSRFFTRAGAFDFDSSGRLVAPGGAIVQGWNADATGFVDRNKPLDDVTLPVSNVVDAEPTTTTSLGGNLSSDLDIGEATSITSRIFDTLGREREFIITFTKTDNNEFEISGSVDGTAGTFDTTTISFGTDGSLIGPDSVDFTAPGAGGADAIGVTLELGGTTGLVQFGGASSVETFAQDGKAVGYLRGFSIGQDGTLTGQFSNGETLIISQLAVATFENPAGLSRVGESRYVLSLNSGQPNIGEAGAGERGTITPGTLEISNVDLAQEFTNLIIAQRGFQANGRVISASDELLADLVNLKR